MIDHNKLWENEFGNANEAEDFAGYTILKCAYNDPNSQFGWSIDHICPKSICNSNKVIYLQITHMYTNELKGDKNTFKIDNTTYQVRRTTKVDENYFANNYNYSNKKYCIVVIED